MPESVKIRSSNRGVAVVLAALIFVAFAGAGWWARTVKNRSSPKPVVRLVPEEAALKKAAPVKEPNATEHGTPVMVEPPAVEPAPPVPFREEVVMHAVAQADSKADRADAVEHEGEIAESGDIHEFSQLRTELERKKLQVEIARQEQQLRDLEFAAYSPEMVQEPIDVNPAPPRIPPRVVSIYGRGNDLEAVIDHPDKGQVTVRLGDVVDGAPVMGISGDGVVVGTGPQKRILGFK